MKALNFLTILALLVTGVSVLGGEYLEQSWLYNVAAIGFGVAGLLAGLRIMISGRAFGASTGMSRYYGETEHTERHSGVQARIIGALLMIGSPVIIALSMLDLTKPGGMEAFWNEFLTSPRSWGLVIGVAGVMVMLMGIVRAKAGTAAAPGARAGIVEKEFRVFGYAATLAGFALQALAVALIVNPDFFQGKLDELFQ